MSYLLNLLPSLRMGFSDRLPLILQDESSECGLACLAMVCGKFGYEIDLVALRQKYSVSTRGTTLKNLIDIAADLFLTTRAVRIEIDSLQYMKLPGILHWDMNHFVVLKRVVTGANGCVTKIVVHDPAVGERVVQFAQISLSFTGVALELSPATGFTKKNVKQAVRIRDLVGSITGFKRSLIQILVLAFALEVFALVSPFFIQLVVDGAILSGDYGFLSMLAVGFALIMLIHTLIGVFRSWMVIYLSTHLNLQWVTNIFGHLLRLPMRFFEKRHLGDIVSRFNATQSIQRTLTTSFAEAVLDGILAVAVIAMMLFYSVKLSLIVFISVFFYFILRQLMYASFRRVTEERIGLMAKEQSLFFESIRGMQAIKLFNNEEDRRLRWLNAFAAATNRGIQAQKMELVFSMSMKLVSGIENILVIWLGAKLVMANLFSVGMLYAFLTYKTLFVSRVYSLIDKFLELKMLSLQCERLADIALSPQEEGFCSEGETDRCDDNFKLQDVTLEIRDLWFRYSDDEPWVVAGVNLTIVPGECLAFVGPSGCGKTTLLKLLLGLLEPVQGEILIGGISIKKFGIRNYRAIIGAVMQDDCLLSGSIAENISFFDQNFDEAWMRQCAQTAAIGNDILQMPMRYQTLIGDMGTSLSGGQKQRLLLARALYKRPEILFLDEATSHLDVDREMEVNKMIAGLSLTKVIVAHRPETIRSADRVVEFFDGTILRDFRNANAEHRA